MKREQTFTTACLERLSALVIVIEDPAAMRGFPLGVPAGITGARGRARPDSYAEVFSSSRAAPFRADTRVSVDVLHAGRAHVCIREPHKIGGL